jgi:hypothetical protein
MTEKASRGDFFAIDARSWHDACSVGLNAAVSYLTMARGTYRDQVTTPWSVKAIEKYTGISRPLAKSAIEALVKGDLIEIVRGGRKPQYRLRPWSEFNILEGPVPDDGTDPPVPWIWLPNTLIDGVPGNAAAPVELVRQTQQIETLRLLIDLYIVHDLPAFGGVHWRIIRQEFTRECLGEWNENAIWQFKRDGDLSVFPDHEIFAPFMTDRERADGLKAIWKSVKLLLSLGLIEFVPHLIEADDDQAAMIHPFGWREGEPAEQRLAIVTHKHGRATKGISETTGGMLVSAKKHMGEIAMVGLLRLRYKPHTQATAIWMSRMDEWNALAGAREAEVEPRTQAASS